MKRLWVWLSRFDWQQGLSCALHHTQCRSAKHRGFCLVGAIALGPTEHSVHLAQCLELTETFVRLAPCPWSLQSLLSNLHHVCEAYRAFCPTLTMFVEPTEPFVQLAPCPCCLQSHLSNLHHVRGAYRTFCPI